MHNLDCIEKGQGSRPAGPSSRCVIEPLTSQYIYRVLMYRKPKKTHFLHSVQRCSIFSKLNFKTVFLKEKKFKKITNTLIIICILYMVLQIVLMGERNPPLVGGGRVNQEFCWGDFLTSWWEPEEEWIKPFKTFSKLEAAFCEYWTSKLTRMCVQRVWN